MQKRTIAILGATGSIGTQALDIVSRYPDRFSAVCLTAHRSSEKLFDLVRKFRPRCAALNLEPETLPDDVRFCEWFFGADSSVRALCASGGKYRETECVFSTWGMPALSEEEIESEGAE